MSAPETSKLLALSRAIQAALKASGIVAEVQPFGRLLEAADIRDVSFSSPAAFLAVLAAPGARALAGGDELVTVEIAVAIAAKGKLGLTADEQTLAVAEAIFVFSAWKQWGLDGVWPAASRRMEIMPVPGKTGVALHAVRWSHQVRIGVPLPDGMGEDESLRPTGDVTLTLGGDDE